MHHGRIGDDAQIAARPANDGLADRHGVVALRQLLFDATVEEFMLKEEHGIIIANGGFEQPFGIVSRGGIDHLQPRRMHEVHFWIGGMKRAAVHTSARGSANNDGHRRAPAIVRLGHKVGDLVKGAGNEIDELHLRHRSQPQVAHAYGGAHDGRFADGSIDHALPAEALQQAGRRFEGAAVNSDILTDQQDRGIAVHLFEERLPDGIEISDRGHGYLRALRGAGAPFLRLRSVCAGCATAASITESRSSARSAAAAASVSRPPKLLIVHSGLTLDFGGVSSSLARRHSASMVWHPSQYTPCSASSGGGKAEFSANSRSAASSRSMRA